MSLTSASAMASVSHYEGFGGATKLTNAVSVPLLLPGGATPYAVWCPQMETCLMKAGVETRDYKVPIAEWDRLVLSVERFAAAEEAAAIAALTQSDQITRAGDPSSTKAVKAENTTPQEAKVSDLVSRKLVLALVKRSRHAYGLLYTAMPEDLRLLAGQVSRGYAYGLWSMLKERYESTRDDNIADVWTRYTQLSQGEEEPYDAYMARVDEVTKLLVGAGQEPPSGLRCVILLGRLQPMYEPAVLVLKATKLKDSKKEIDWSEIKQFILDHERQKLRVGDASLLSSDERALAARSFGASRRHDGQGDTHSDGSRDRRSERKRDMSKVKCFKCNEFGHMARDCEMHERDSEFAGDQEDDYQEENREERASYRKKAPARRYREQDSDEEYERGRANSVREVIEYLF